MSSTWPGAASFSEALDRLRVTPEPGTDYARSFVNVFAVTGAAVSTLGDLLGTETVSASDEQAARLDELQFDLGEGPCWDALRLAAPVFEPDLRSPVGSWPAFTHAIRDERVSAIFAFPLTVGPLKIGAVDMYCRTPAMLNQAQSQQATVMADLVARRIMADALQRSSVDFDEDSNPRSRRIVHQATGMVLAQLHVNADDARLVIQSHAFANERSMMEVARDIVDGRIDFSVGQDRIGDAQ